MQKGVKIGSDATRKSGVREPSESRPGSSGGGSGRHKRGFGRLPDAIRTPWKLMSILIFGRLGRLFRETTRARVTRVRTLFLFLTHVLMCI